MKSLMEIDSFGAIDADNDDLLLQCFEDHDAFIDALKMKKFLIVGRKGTGKTAIYKKIISTRDAEFFSYGHTFSDYPWHHHEMQAKIGIPDYDKYTHSWKYLILLTLSKIILNHDNSLPYNEETMDDMIKIERFVVDSYGTRDPDVTQIFSPTKRLKFKPYFEIDWKLLKAGISPENVPMEELPVIVQEVNNNLLIYSLSVLNPNNRYYICFDQLDLGFDPSNPEYSNRLIGLLLACRDINIKAKEYKKNFSIVVFLRDDIYEKLHFEDKNKITENFLSLIEWDTERTQKSLKNLMERRYKTILSDDKDIVNWEEIFDEIHKMPGHQTKYQFILDRTFLRPRDMIKFCNSILEQYKIRVMKGTDQDVNKFVNEDVHIARTNYGTYFLREIDDEIHKHIPNYGKFLEIFRGINIVRFTKEEFLDEYAKRAAAFPDVKDPFDILKQLYDFSILGFYKPGGRGYGGSEYVFKYKNPSQDFDLTSRLFQVHLGLLDVLGLKRYAKK